MKSGKPNISSQHSRFPVIASAGLLTVTLLIGLMTMWAEQPTAAPSSATPTSRTQPVHPAAPPDTALEDAIRRGATMEEIARLRDPIATNPNDAVRALKTGNARFFGGVAQRPELSANERRAQVLSQTPFAAVLSCSDSRVPTEIVYDQSLGSLFVVRVAGNFVDPATLGSLEYAVVHLKSYVVVIMGHEGCGAVQAATLTPEQLRSEPENVRYLVKHIEPSVRDLPRLRDNKARMREAVIANVRLQVHRLKQNPTIAAAVKSGKIRVIGAYYEISSGAVDFLDSDEELRLSPEELRRASR